MRRPRARSSGILPTSDPTEPKAAARRRRPPSTARARVPASRSPQQIENTPREDLQAPFHVRVRVEPIEVVVRDTYWITQSKEHVALRFGRSRETAKDHPRTFFVVSCHSFYRGECGPHGITS